MPSHEERRVLVAFVGCGLIGKEVLHLFSSALSQQTFTVVSISNSKNTISQSHTTSPLSGDALLALLPASNKTVSPHESPTSASSVTYSSADPLELLTTLTNLHSSTCLPIILMDCTASLSLASLYPNFIASLISIVTPNKKAFSSSQSLWDEINEAQRLPDAGWVYHEGTVGAGLPVISTLRDVVISGDEVQRIEGITSGTLSAVFNAFSKPGGKGSATIKFGEAVRNAREEGLTEPNPAEDLAGSDVARKLTILTRIASLSPSSTSPPFPSLPNGFESIPTETLVPLSLRGISNGDEFIARLSDHDADFDRLRDEAEAAYEVIRYVGQVDRASGVVKCGLQMYPSSHPFATLAGSDNVIAFHTKHYSQRPLVIQGPADFTAAGVLADAFKVAERGGFGIFL
ncbi:hypothetical protein P7C70_g3716, partial [Phenoliferia sp. Uapishka_3]